ncbi:MAG: alpha-2-macroglobulin family protein [Trueperaceae bacterium]|nr:alpha-2-macroglobulin family protein [Trueperaceae bacterium]
MPWSKLALALILTLPWLAPSASAQGSTIPERYATTVSDTDYPGNDIASLFDVTLEQCQANCLREGGCVAFTFNVRQGACFLKENLGEPVPFVGALSGVITGQPADALQRAEAAAATLTFLDTSDLTAAREQAETLAESYQAEGRTEADWLAAAQAQEPADAVAATGAAVTVADSGPAWLAHARALAAQAAKDPDRRYTLNRRAFLAALNATLRLPESDRAAALVVLSQTLEATFRGQAALEAMRLADRLTPGVAPEELARLREAFGFRVLSHDVDASTAAPRICVTFSEDLSPARDYAPFVRRTATALALEVEGQQLCVAGAVYGKTYDLTLRAGLPSAGGDSLARDVPLTVYVRDREPTVRFPGRTYVLPAAGPRALPVETVNADRLELRLLRVSDRNVVTAIRQGSFLQALSAWDGARFEDLLTEPVWDGEAQLIGDLNNTTTSLLPLDDVGALAPGVYVLRASVPGADPYDTPPATQWFLVSDLGVTTLAGTDGLHVVVQRLSDGRPVAGLHVELVARSNRVLGEGSTDAEGHAMFPAGLARGTGNAAPALVLVEGADDLAVLSLEEPEFDLSDRGVAGRLSPGPLDVFMTTDRGAYRPSETVHLTALVRDAGARAVSGLPLTVLLVRPDGVEHARVVTDGGVAGGHVAAFSLGSDVPRGVWRLETYADPDAPALAAKTVLVEDFLPERSDFTLTLGDGAPVDVSAPPDLSLEARYLFGAPAAGLTLSGSVGVATTSELADWPGYSFGRHDQRVDTQRRVFPAGLTTDAAGRLAAPLPLAGLELDARPYTLTVQALLLDGSSRPVERDLTLPLRPTGPVVGIRPSFDGAVPENGEAGFDLVLVAPDGAVLDGELRWQVDRVLTRYQWYAVDGRWFWEPVTERQRVGEGTVSVVGGPGHVSVPVTWGQYELRATYDGGTSAGQPQASTRQAGSFATASVAFSAGWYGVDATRDTPDLLEVSLDAASYAPGDVARLRIVPEGAGTALVAVLSDQVVDLRLVDVDGETTVDLNVTEEWGTGAYVVASLVRPSGAAGHVPARSLGVAHAAVAPGERALDVTLTAPAAADPRGRLNVVLSVPDVPDRQAFATVAAVDVGVLNLTGFAAPDPQGYFFGQRRLGVAVRDLYGRLIDASQGALGQVRSGGGAETEAVNAGPAPAEELLALFSGPITLVDGRAELGFDLPAFNGTVRLMAVVWSETAVGQAQADVLVRDPVVVQPSLPRFMTPGDASRLRIELTHASGPAGEMGLSVEGYGLGEAPAAVTLAAGGRAVVDVPLQPAEAGEYTYRIALTTPDGRVLEREVRLSVRHTDPETARTEQFVLAPGETFLFDAAALVGFRPGTARATLFAGAGAALDQPGLVQRLLAYPYGCTEQLASTLAPLLWAPGAVSELGLLTDAEARSRAQDAVDRILTRQGRTGSFGLWGAGGYDYDLWLDVYTTDVLLRAEAQGLSVPATPVRMALDNLRNEVAQTGTLQGGAAGYAYAFYVLARAGEAAIGDLRYYADTLAERFDTPLAAAHLGAALAAYGEVERSEALFARAQDLALAPTDDGGWRADYGTTLRDRAGLLALAVEAGSKVVDRVRLANLVANGAPANLLSTQEAAWVLRAAVALGEQSQGLVVDERPVAGNVVRLYAGAPATLRNDGAEDVLVTLTTFGVPEVAPEAGGVGYTITRSHYTPDGAPADLGAVKVGDRLVVVLEVRPDRGVAGGRLMIDDALAAGFEIDNANLLREGDIRAFDWLRVPFTADMTEARSERFLAAGTWTSEEPLRLAYVMRAVSPGTFRYPAAKVEDMYRPGNYALSATDVVTIRP